MSLLRQEPYFIGYYDKEDAFNHDDDYYYETRQKSMMDVTKALISDIPFPIFIIDSDSHRILFTNQLVSSASKDFELKNVKFENAVQVFGTEVNGEKISFFDNRWYTLKSHPLECEGKLCQVIKLQPRQGIPDSYTLETWKNMIAVMLHRFRSPLTGITGYLEMVEEETENETHKKWLGIVNQGVDQLYDMMDELEDLYNISSNYEEADSKPVNATAIIKNIILSLPEEKTDRVRFKEEENQTFIADPNNLKRVLQILIQNAIEHSDNGNSSIDITLESGRFIKVTNKGEAIPDSIKGTIFHPFVTSKANNLGIGLTMALLFARQFGGTIFLDENSSEKEISFTLCFPALETKG